MTDSSPNRVLPRAEARAIRPGRPRWDREQGESLRQWRILRGLRQQDLAERVGQPRTVLSNWENGLRAPSATNVEALSRSLDVDPAVLLTAPPATPAADPAPNPPSTYQAFTNGSGTRRVTRFRDQVTTFAALAENEIAAARWSRLRAASYAVAADLPGDTTGRGSGARSVAVGTALATAIRTHLGTATGPLPALHVTAERCGAHIFLATLGGGDTGRLRAITVEQPSIGLSVLVNAAQDDARRLQAFAEALGQQLLEPAVGEVALMWPREAQPRAGARLGQAAAAFAAEFVLPRTAASLAAAAVEPLQQAIGGTNARRRAQEIVLADMVQTYTCPVGVALERLREPWRLGKAKTARLLVSASTSLARALSHGLEPTHGLNALPPRFVELLLTQVNAATASVQGIAELAGVDVAEVEELRLRQLAADSASDDGWLDADWALAAGPAVA
jgi:transcriptional regulator with XRE-family HTH domain